MGTLIPNALHMKGDKVHMDPEAATPMVSVVVEMGIAVDESQEVLLRKRAVKMLHSALAEYKALAGARNLQWLAVTPSSGGGGGGAVVMSRDPCRLCQVGEHKTGSNLLLSRPPRSQNLALSWAIPGSHPGMHRPPTHPCVVGGWSHLRINLSQMVYTQKITPRTI